MPVEKMPARETLTPPKIILEFFRHGVKEKESGSSEVRITPESRAEAQAKGQALNPQTEVSLGWSSPRARTRETAAHVMLANAREVTPDMTLEEIDEVISKNLPVGDKIKPSELLNYHSSDTELNRLGHEALVRGDYLKFLVEQSDDLAIKYNDQIESTYSRLAGQVAQIIAHYLKINVKFRHPRHQKLERYLATHQTVGECFIAKVLEKTQGLASRDAFVAALHGRGFDELQGFRVEIDKQNINLFVALNGQTQTINVPLEILKQIIQEGDD